MRRVPSAFVVTWEKLSHGKGWKAFLGEHIANRVNRSIYRNTAAIDPRSFDRRGRNGYGFRCNPNQAVRISQDNFCTLIVLGGVSAGCAGSRHTSQLPSYRQPWYRHVSVLLAHEAVGQARAAMRTAVLPRMDGAVLSAPDSQIDCRGNSLAPRFGAASPEISPTGSQLGSLSH